MKEQEAPGTTFKRHHEIARGLLSEDDYLLSEILLNPHSLQQVIRINKSLENLISMIKKEDTSGLKSYFGELRENLGMQIKDSEQ
jgi:prephenate dehydrogenase